MHWTSELKTTPHTSIPQHTGLETMQTYAVFLVLTPMVIKSYFSWDITRLEIIWNFGGKCRLHLQSRKISQARNKNEASWASHWFLVWLILRSWKWRWNFRPKRRFISNELYGVISQNIEPFNVGLMFSDVISTTEYMIRWDEKTSFDGWVERNKEAIVVESILRLQDWRRNLCQDRW
jgi:hypothetical protein